MRISDWSSDVCSSDLELKCSKTIPCGVCRKAGVVCEYREVDRKRRPASQDHVVLLQSRVAWLEDFIQSLQNASPRSEERRVGKECGSTCRSRGSPSN